MRDIIWYFFDVNIKSMDFKFKDGLSSVEINDIFKTHLSSKKAQKWHDATEWMGRFKIKLVGGNMSLAMNG